MPTPVEQLVFRTAQEALRNTGMHSDAQHVAVTVGQANGAVTLRVRDDGHGFDVARLGNRREEGHFGLSMLRDLSQSAGAELRISSHPGAGTTIELEVPVR